MQRQPRDQSNQSDFRHEDGIDVRSIEILLQQHNRHKISESCRDLHKQHLETVLVYLGEHIQQLDTDQARECDCHDIRVAIVEEKNAENQNY